MVRTTRNLLVVIVSTLPWMLSSTTAHAYEGKYGYCTHTHGKPAYFYISEVFLFRISDDDVSEHWKRWLNQRYTWPVTGKQFPLGRCFAVYDTAAAAETRRSEEMQEYRGYGAPVTEMDYRGEQIDLPDRPQGEGAR